MGCERVSVGDSSYVELASPLTDLQGSRSGKIRILRSFDAARRRIAMLRENIVVIWLLAVLAGLILTFALARRILKPVQALDRAASEISKRNYDVHRADSERGRTGAAGADIQ